MPPNLILMQSEGDGKKAAAAAGDGSSEDIGEQATAVHSKEDQVKEGGRRAQHETSEERKTQQSPAASRTEKTDEQEIESQPPTSSSEARGMAEASPVRALTAATTTLQQAEHPSEGMPGLSGRLSEAVGVPGPVPGGVIPGAQQLPYAAHPYPHHILVGGAGGELYQQLPYGQGPVGASQLAEIGGNVADLARRQSIPVSPKRKASRKKRPKDMPKRPLSAYNIFFRDERENILKEIPAPHDYSEEGADAGEHLGERSADQVFKEEEEFRREQRLPHGKIGFENLARTISKRWKEISTEKHEHYKRLADLEMKRYKADMEVYNDKKKRRVLEDRKEKMEAEVAASVDTKKQYDTLVSQQQNYGMNPSQELASYQEQLALSMQQREERLLRTEMEELRRRQAEAALQQAHMASLPFGGGWMFPPADPAAQLGLNRGAGFPLGGGMTPSSRFPLGFGAGGANPMFQSRFPYGLAASGAMQSSSMAMANQAFLSTQLLAGRQGRPAAAGVSSELLREHNLRLQQQMLHNMGQSPDSSAHEGEAKQPSSPTSREAQQGQGRRPSGPGGPPYSGRGPNL